MTLFKKNDPSSKNDPFSKNGPFSKNALFSVGLTLSGPDVPAWAPEGREVRSQAGPKGRKLEDILPWSIFDNTFPCKLGSLSSIKWLWEWWYLWSKVTTDHSPRWLLDIYTASSLSTSQYTSKWHSELLHSLLHSELHSVHLSILHSYLHCKLPCLDSIYGLVWITGQIPTLNSNHLHFHHSSKQQYFRGSTFPNWHILKQ